MNDKGIGNEMDSGGFALTVEEEGEGKQRSFPLFQRSGNACDLYGIFDRFWSVHGNSYRSRSRIIANSRPPESRIHRGRHGGKLEFVTGSCVVDLKHVPW